MWKHSQWIGVALLLALVPSSAFARWPRNAPTVGVNGVLYNTNSPEWRQAGGNIYVYEQIMAQKAMMQQQQLMMKQQQAYMQMQKKFAASNPGAASANAAARLQAIPRKKKKPRTYDPTHPVTSGAQSKAAEASTSKP